MIKKRLGVAEKGTYIGTGSIIREGLIYREVNILKRWITNSEREERRLCYKGDKYRRRI